MEIALATVAGFVVGFCFGMYLISNQYKDYINELLAKLNSIQISQSDFTKVK